MLHRTTRKLVTSAATIENEKVMTSVVPNDFPRDPWPTAISGAQLKIGARLIDGKYTAGLTNDERHARYAVCADLVNQLVQYCQRKHKERPNESLAVLLHRVDEAIRKKGWDLSSVELTWCMTKVSEALSVED